MTDVFLHEYAAADVMPGNGDDIQPRLIVRSNGQEVRFIGSLEDIERMLLTAAQSLHSVQHPVPYVPSGHFGHGFDD